MRSRRRRSQVLGADHCDDAAPATDTVGPETAEASSSLTEAEEDAARAESRAEAARVRAMQLRRRVEDSSSDQLGKTDNADAKDDDTSAVEDGAGATEPTAAKSRWWQLRSVRRPSQKALGISAATVLISASFVTSGYMVWQHLTLVNERQRSAEFVAAARQGIVTLMSIDPSHAKENVQRSIDGTTGQLKSQLQVTSTFLVKDAEDAKVTTKATVEDAAAESTTANSAVVLVIAKSDTTNPDKTKRPPAWWRLSVDINRDGGQLKISKVEFVQ
jgi:Mce-associated membrane protein